MTGPRPRPSTSTWLIAMLTTGFGVFAAFAAAGGSGPFGNLHPRPVQHLVGGQLRGTPLDAGALFTPPPRPVVTHTIDFYDPPPPSRPAAAPAPAVARPIPTPPPSPLPTATPTESGDGGPND